jgi:hypothetical protein
MYVIASGLQSSDMFVMTCLSFKFIADCTIALGLCVEYLCGRLVFLVEPSQPTLRLSFQSETSLVGIKSCRKTQPALWKPGSV